MQQGGQHPAGLPGPEVPVAAGLTGRGDPGQQVGGPLGRGLRLAAARQRVEGDRRREPGQPGRVEHPHRSPLGPQRAGQLDQVGAGTGGDHRALGVEDPAGQLPGLARPRTADPQRHVLDRRPHPEQTDPGQPGRHRRGRRPQPLPPRQLAQAGPQHRRAPAYGEAGHGAQQLHPGGDAVVAAGPAGPAAHHTARPGPALPDHRERPRQHEQAGAEQQRPVLVTRGVGGQRPQQRREADQPQPGGEQGAVDQPPRHQHRRQQHQHPGEHRPQTGRRVPSDDPGQQHHHADQRDPGHQHALAGVRPPHAAPPWPVGGVDRGPGRQRRGGHVLEHPRRHHEAPADADRGELPRGDRPVQRHLRHAQLTRQLRDAQPAPLTGPETGLSEVAPRACRFCRCHTKH